MGQLQFKEIPLAGKWRKSIDPLLADESDFTDIQNLRPYERGYRAVNGMSKINTTALTTNLKPRAGFHFSKESPSQESHVLVQVWNSGETGSSVKENTTAIPGTGDFVATALKTETNTIATGRGRFSDAPNGQVAYCNGVDNPDIWAGDETNLARFIVASAAPVNTISNPRDYTDEINNDLTDSDRLATVGGGNDSNTIVMLHGNGADNGTTITDDAVGGAHTWTAAGAAVTDQDQKKFGSASLYFNGAAACQINCDADHDDFQFNAGTGVFTIDFWFRFAALPSSGAYMGIYEQYVDSDHTITIHVYNNAGTYSMSFYVRNQVGASLAYGVATITGAATNTWYHCAIVRGYGGSANSLRIAIDGTFGANTDMTGVTIPNLAAAPYLGYCQYASAGRFNGWIEEFRISKVARWTANFSPPSTPYYSGSYALLGVTRPADAFKFYIDDANTETATLGIWGWNGSSWTNWKDTDNTSGLTSTGTITLSDNKDLAKPRYFNGMVLYWYYVYLSTGSATIYRVTADLPWQRVRNLWDGSYRSPLAFFHWDNDVNQYLDYSLDVNVDANVNYSAGPVASLDNLAASVDYVVIGFNERIRGVVWRMYKGEVNSTADCDLSVYYWNGDSWVLLTGVNDDTVENDVSLAKSGVISWECPERTDEQRTEINSSTPLYFYKFSWDAALDASVDVDRIFGIAEGEEIKPHKFPIMHHGRLFLCNETDGEKNTMLPSAPYAPDCYNGKNAGQKIYFGDDKALTAAATFYTRYGADMFYQMVVCKNNETWLLDGDGFTGSNPWKTYQISKVIGCPAPNTMVVADIGHEMAAGILKQVVIWLSDVGPMIFDGNTITPIGYDIEDYWNPSKTSTCINSAQIVDAYAWYDPQFQEYHLCIPTGSNTTNDTELVFNLVHKKWTKLNRGSGQAVQVGFPVRDTSGKVYTYGAIDTGFLLRLENSNAFISTAITSYFETVDIPLSGSMFRWHLLEYFKLVCVSKPSTPDDTITVTVYKDTETSGTNVGTFVNEESGQRCVINVEPAQVIAGVTHRVRVSVAVSDVAEGFEALAIGYAFRVPEDEPEVVD